MRVIQALLLLLLATPAVTAVADESSVKLKDAPGKEVVEVNCVMCHSLDYIPMNSVFLDRKAWEGSVNKMVKVMGAPISPEEAKKIVDYLGENYAKK
jgi:cytochrome c5